MQPCAHDPTKKCFGYNGIGDLPRTPKGTPVCQRSFFEYGKHDSNTGCPKEYSVVLNHNACQVAANCLDLCEEHDFRVGEENQTEHLNYPVGCFLHNKGPDGS